MFEPLKSQSQQIKVLESGFFAFIKHKKSGNYLDIVTVGDNATSQKRANEKFMGLSKPTIQHLKNEHEVFRLYQCNQNDTFEMNFVLACNSSLFKLLISLKEFNPTDANSEKIRRGKLTLLNFSYPEKNKKNKKNIC